MKKRTAFIAFFVILSNLLFAGSSGIITDAGVRLRRLPRIENSEVLTLLEKGSPVSVFAVTEDTLAINGESFPWFRISVERDENVFHGWVWGKFVSVREISEVPIANKQDIAVTFFAQTVFIESIGIPTDHLLTTAQLGKFIPLGQGQIRGDRFRSDYDWRRVGFDAGEALFESGPLQDTWCSSSITIDKLEKNKAHPIYIGQSEAELRSAMGEPVILENKLVYWVRYVNFAATGYWSIDVTVKNLVVMEICLQANHD